MTASEAIGAMFGRLSLFAAIALAPTLAPAQSETLDAGIGAGTVESVREVPVVSDIHAFDPGVLEHPVHPETAEEVVIRLDVGPVIIFTSKAFQRLRAGQRVRVILTGSSAHVEPAYSARD